MDETGTHAETEAGRFQRLIHALSGEPGVATGGRGKTFGASALRVEGRIFAMLTAKGEFVVKLPRARVDALTRSGAGEPFDPGHGRRMKEWLATRGAPDTLWSELAREALDFVRGGR